MALSLFNQLIQDEEVKTCIKKADEVMAVAGYTEHGLRHARLVGEIAQSVAERIGFSLEEQDLAACCGLLHDLGNVVGRRYHEVVSGLLAKDILEKYHLKKEEILEALTAIVNHEETTGHILSRLTAVLVLADKTDVHQSRVRNMDLSSFDLHDRVNYAVKKSFLKVEAQAKTITLELTIDVKISQPMEYFEIFLPRLLMCKKAAEYLGYKFSLKINQNQLL